MLLYSIFMIITSTQQIEEMINPSNALDMTEFEDTTLKLGSFVCIAKKKKFNFLNFLKLILEDEKTQKIYFNLLGETNIQLIIRAYLNSTPNVYKKIFRSKFNHKNKN